MGEDVGLRRLPELWAKEVHANMDIPKAHALLEGAGDLSNRS